MKKLFTILLVTVLTSYLILSAVTSADSLLDSFLFICNMAIIYWVITLKPKVIGKDGASGLSAEVYNAIPNLYTDKDFVKDFVKILQQESNLEDIIEKSQTQWYALKNKNRTGPKYRDTFFDQEDYQDLIKGNIKGYGFQPDAKRISQNVIKSNGYKKFSKKHKFKAGDDRDMVGIIYYIITRNDFAEAAKKYLYAAASDNKNISIPPLPKGAFDGAAGA